MENWVKNIFQLPNGCLFQTVFPKKQFEKRCKLTTAENKILREPFLPEKSVLQASLQQKLSFVPALVTDEMDYKDILFFALKLKHEHLKKHTEKLINLYQKHIPKPCVLVLYSNDEFIINTAQKKYNEADKNKRVIVSQHTTPILKLTQQNAQQNEFLKVLQFKNIQKNNLQTLHQSYVNAIVSLNIANETGVFKPPKPEDYDILRQVKDLEKQIQSIKNNIKKTKDIDQRIRLNMQKKQLEGELRVKSEELRM